MAGWSARLRQAAFLAAWGLLAPPAALLAAPSGSKQAQYDAAQAAYDKQDWAAAAAGFAPLLPAAGSAFSPSQAVIAVRLGDSLVALQQYDDARSWLDRVVAAAGTLEPDMRAFAFFKLGEADRSLYDYHAAAGAYDRAIAEAEAAKDRALGFQARFGLAYADGTIDPVHVTVELDKLLGDTGLMKSLGKPRLADLEDLRARAAINAGDAKSAARWIERAVDHSGGLGTNVTFAQATIRADAAIIARLRHDDDDTREYLTYTGAGHMESTDWIGHFAGQLPVCGGDIRPDDSVVVQFFLADNGHVQGALPVYASRQGDIGMTFARAVDSWRWPAGEVGKVNMFWRNTLRLELRCVSRPEPLSLAKPFVSAANAWLKRLRMTQNQDMTTFSYAVDAAARPDGDLATLLSDAGSTDAAYEARLQAALDAAHAPASVQALIAMRVVSRNTANADSIQEHARRRARALGGLVPDFQRRFPADPATAWLTLEWALALEDNRAFATALPLLKEIAGTPTSALPADDPIRTVAALHLALAEREAGTTANAPPALTRANTEMCSLVDTHPIPQSVSIASSQFPQEALRWRFEGYVREDYDIGADGHVSNIRTVVAYPPFIFGPATENAVKRFRYVAPSIDGHAVGCAGKSQSVNYRIPQR